MGALNSKFFQLILDAFTANDNETPKDLFKIADYVDDDFVIQWIDEGEIMEATVRILTDMDIQYHNLYAHFKVANVPEDKQVYWEWFIKTFAYLESETSNWDLDEETVFKCGIDHKEMLMKLGDYTEEQLEELYFLYPQVTVEFV